MRDIHEIYLVLHSATEEGEVVLRGDLFRCARRIQRPVYRDGQYDALNLGWMTEVNGGEDNLYVKEPPELIADMVRELRNSEV